MKNDPLLISFGGVVVGFSGDLPDPGEQVFLFAQPEAVPDVKVRITETDALPKPQGAELLYTATGLKMFGRETKRWALYSNPNRADGPNHAALCYDTDAPDDLELCFNSRKMALNIQSVLSSIMLETLLLRHGRGVLHASYIRLPNERSILFSAPSGTGKSTQAELWRRYRNAQIINGDKAIVYLASEGVSVSSLPLCGSSGICRNVSGSAVWEAKTRSRRCSPSSMSSGERQRPSRGLWHWPQGSPRAFPCFTCPACRRSPR